MTLDGGRGAAHDGDDTTGFAHGTHGAEGLAGHGQHVDAAAFERTGEGALIALRIEMRGGDGHAVERERRSERFAHQVRAVEQQTHAVGIGARRERAILADDRMLPARERRIRTTNRM